MESEPKKKYWSAAFKALSSLLILGLLYRSLDFSGSEFTTIWKQMNPVWLASTLPVVVLVLGIKSLRWHSIIISSGHRYHWKKATAAYFAAYSLGVVSPGRLGEFLKVYNLKTDIPNLDVVPAFRTVVLDRLFDMFFLSWFGLAGLLFYFRPFGALHPTISLLASLIVLVVLLFANKWFAYFVSVKYFTKGSLLQFILDCLDEMASLQSIRPWFFSAIAYVVYFVGIRLLFFSLELTVSFLEAGFIISLIGLILLLPISVAGFGTREAGLIYLLSFYQIDPEVAVSFSLLQFMVFFVWGGLIGLVFWLISPVSLNQVKVDLERLWTKFRGSKKHNVH